MVSNLTFDTSFKLLPFGSADSILGWYWYFGFGAFTFSPSFVVISLSWWNPTGKIYRICGSFGWFTTLACFPSVSQLNSLGVLLFLIHSLNLNSYVWYFLTKSLSFFASTGFIAVLFAAFFLLSSGLVLAFGCCTWSTSSTCQTASWIESTPFWPGFLVSCITSLIYSSPSPQYLVLSWDINPPNAPSIPIIFLSTESLCPPVISS